MTRIVDQARASLEAQGHELVEFNMPDIHGMGKRYYQVLMTVGPREVEECLMGEPPVWFNAPVLDIGESRLVLKFSLLMLRMLGYERMAGLLDYKVAVNSKAYMELFQDFNDYTLAVTKAWTDLKLDACIGPSMGLPAFPHRGSELMTPFLCYQILINSLQYPAGVVPVGRVLPGEDNYDSKVEDALTRKARKVMKGAVGLPLAIQVIALPYEDEKALAVMKLLEGIFNFHEHPL
jgi:Asp-tRNA(Asn)/Glu-tRNA(Gln) amidotransferase A subunit family amidase